MIFSNERPFNLKECLITKNFAFHNCFSILPENKFNFENIMDNNYEEIIKYKDKFTFIPLSDENQNILKWHFGIIGQVMDVNNEFAIFGYFDKIEDFSKKFCIWYNIKEKKIYYYVNDNLKSIEEKNFNLNCIDSEKKGFILICAKYKYKYLTQTDLEKLTNKLVKGIKKIEKKNI